MQILFPKTKAFQLGVLYIYQIFIEVWGFLVFGGFKLIFIFHNGFIYIPLYHKMFAFYL